MWQKRKSKKENHSISYSWGNNGGSFFGIERKRKRENKSIDTIQIDENNEVEIENIKE